MEEEEEIVYNIKKQLGAGAFGKVYLVTKSKITLDQEEEDTLHLFVMKVIRITPRNLSIIENEVSILKKISEENKCHLYKNNSFLCLEDSYIDTETNEYIIITNYLNNSFTLAELINSDYRFNFDDYYFIISRLITQLQSLHSNGIVHGDIKPQNVIVQLQTTGYDKNVKNILFIDYGLSCLGSKCIVGGTLQYLSPEIIPLLAKKIDNSIYIKSDIWSLGVLFYQLLNRKFPFTTYFQNNLLNTNSENNLPIDITIMSLYNFYKNNQIELSHYSFNDTSDKLVKFKYNYPINRLVDLMLNTDPSKRPNINDVYIYFFNNVIKQQLRDTRFGSRHILH